MQPDFDRRFVAEGAPVVAAMGSRFGSFGPFSPQLLFPLASCCYTTGLVRVIAPRTKTNPDTVSLLLLFSSFTNKTALCIFYMSCVDTLQSCQENPSCKANTAIFLNRCQAFWTGISVSLLPAGHETRQNLLMYHLRFFCSSLALACSSLLRNLASASASRSTWAALAALNLFYHEMGTS